ncbi:capping protein inhibiting regulator of actin dynamics-like [Pectinophora gossypiella]|uniref:capping protein inhibiting regulator of actin dynamics-like n=1 Tax=Pectinophora gossypiella TaxID=13191 RepID=UPI00214EAA41|nr:capping protein inhibiting regulator of actin dynamics-like [Pectinophora gossypiella]
MVFCYKIITESPLRSGCVSPRKASPMGRLPDIHSSLSQLMNTTDYHDVSGSIMDDIPDREWRLLATLLRKREQDIEREKLADEFRKMWQKEKEERNMIAAESSEQYKKFLHQKREEQRLLQELRSFQRQTEEQMKQGLLVNSLRHKEKRSASVLAWCHDKKTFDLVEKVIDSEAKALLAADRRCRQDAADEWKKKAELVDWQKKADEARRRKNAMLKETSQRVAINNALSSWETALLKEGVNVMDEFKRAQHAAHAELTHLRSVRLARARDSRLKRARRLATITQQLREAVRMARS